MLDKATRTRVEGGSRSQQSGNDEGGDGTERGPIVTVSPTLVAPRMA